MQRYIIIKQGEYLLTLDEIIDDHIEHIKDACEFSLLTRGYFDVDLVSSFTSVRREAIERAFQRYGWHQYDSLEKARASIG
jgi:hypothetical protein